MRRRVTVGLVLALAMVLAPRATDAQGKTNRDQSENTSLREDGYPVRTGLDLVAADEAGLRDDDMILGVVIEGDARAYPVNLMWEPQNEVLNDTVGGAAITATW